jgi:L-lactate permease
MRKESLMNLLPVLLALSPVVVIFLLLILRRTAADVAGVAGWVVTVGIA